MIPDLKEFCQLFYSVTYIPMTLYDASDECCYYFPSALQDFPINNFFRSGALRFTKNPDYMISSANSFIGYVSINGGENYILVGPLFNLSPSKEDFANFVAEWAVRKESSETLLNLMRDFPKMSIYQSLQVLALLHMQLNCEVLDIKKHFYIDESNQIVPISSRLSREMMQNKETQELHNIHPYEQLLFHSIVAGDTKKVKKLLEHP